MKSDSLAWLIGILAALVIAVGGGYWYSCSLKDGVTKIWKATLWEDCTNRLREIKVKKKHLFSPATSSDIKIETEGQTLHLKRDSTESLTADEKSFLADQYYLSRKNPIKIEKLDSLFQLRLKEKGLDCKTAVSIYDKATKETIFYGQRDIQVLHDYLKLTYKVDIQDVILLEGYVKGGWFVTLVSSNTYYIILSLLIIILCGKLLMIKRKPRKSSTLQEELNHPTTETDQLVKASESLSPEPTPAESLPSESMSPEATPAESLPSESMSSEPTPAESLPAESLSPEPTPVESLPSESLSPEATPAESLPSESLSPEPTPAESLPSESMSSEPTPAESLPSESMSPEPTPAESLPSESLSPEPTPVESLPSESMSPEATPAESLPSESMSPEPTPAESLPSEPTFPVSVPQFDEEAKEPVEENVEVSSIPLTDIIYLDVEKHTVTYTEKTILLAPKLFDLFYYLLQGKDHFQSYEFLIDNLWREGPNGAKRHVEQIKIRLQKELESISDWEIITVRGSGYQLDLKKELIVRMER